MTDKLSFHALGLAPAPLASLIELGYEAPTPVQAQSIPILLDGHDLLALAQTGTGKTAAFALPILSNLDLSHRAPQALVITPTRELAIQVAEAFQSYAAHMEDFHVAAIYGGQDYQIQQRALKRGAQVVVGTPGRLMDHLRQGTLSISTVNTLVLDEADEMLRMGFIDDVEWILKHIPHDHQTALFSATMPDSIRKIVKNYLTDAKKVHIKSATNSVASIAQSYMQVTNNQKMDALTRYLEVEELQAVIVFSRTKTGSAEIAQKLQARGYAAAALNGDMKQSLRKKVLDQIKSGALDIIVATDVAARGIDIDRISHVINFDIPTDAESYIHRIGRTGRAGRQGKALLLVAPREHHLLRDIERTTKKEIALIEPPTLQEMSAIRTKQLLTKVIGVIEKSKQFGHYHSVVETMINDSQKDPQSIAAALAYLLEQTNPLPSGEIEHAAPEEGGDQRRRRKRRSNAGGDHRGKGGFKPHKKRSRHAGERGQTKERDGKTRESGNRRDDNIGRKKKRSSGRHADQEAGSPQTRRHPKAKRPKNGASKGAPKRPKNKTNTGAPKRPSKSRRQTANRKPSQR